MVEGYLKNFEDKDWLEVIQNFRVSDKKKLVNNVDKNMFVKKNIFNHLEKNNIMEVKRKIKLLNSKILKDSSSEELVYIKSKRYDTDVMHNVMFFHVLKTKTGGEVEIKYI